MPEPMRLVVGYIEVFFLYFGVLVYRSCPLDRSLARCAEMIPSERPQMRS